MTVYKLLLLLKNSLDHTDGPELVHYKRHHLDKAIIKEAQVRLGSDNTFIYLNIY